VNNQEILANAPEGATHVEIESCGDYEYWRLKGNLFEWYHFCSMTQDFIYSYQNVDSESIEDIHSLADIKRIIELEYRVAELVIRRGVQKQDFDERIADLKQQAKAYTLAEFMCPESMREKARQLRKQAKQLKSGAE
jgi:hypothetical protein